MKDIRAYLGEASHPWKRGAFIGAAGVLAAGWTEDNKVFILCPDYFLLANPLTGEREFLIEGTLLLKRLSKDNLEFDLKELKQKIKVFGVRGGNGNHYTTDGWHLIEVMQDSQEKIFGMSNHKHFGRTEQVFWKNYDLLKLRHLEYGLWWGFSPNEKSFGIFGPGGVEIFNRE